MWWWDKLKTAGWFVLRALWILVLMWTLLVMMLWGAEVDAGEFNRGETIAWYAGPAAGDLLSTEIALRRGGVHEANPLYQRRGVRIGIKSGATLGIILLDKKAMKRDKRLGWGMRIGWWLANGWATYHNLRRTGNGRGERK